MNGVEIIYVDTWKSSSESGPLLQIQAQQSFGIRNYRVLRTDLAHLHWVPKAHSNKFEVGERELTQLMPSA